MPAARCADIVIHVLEAQCSVCLSFIVGAYKNATQSALSDS